MPLQFQALEKRRRKKFSKLRFAEQLMPTSKWGSVDFFERENERRNSDLLRVGKRQQF